jgi:hypothetical protein
VAWLVLLFAAVIGLHVVQARTPLAPPGVASGDLLYVRSPAVARRMALSYDSLLADVYWIRAVQYYGRTKLSADAGKDYALLFPLLDFSTSLDPRFDVAYRFGAVFLAEPMPNGAGRPGDAIRLLEKGLRNQPDKWEFAGDIGFVHYFWRHDYDAAAEWFRRASRMPNGPDWMAALAARVSTEGGNLATSRRLWREILAGDNAQYLKELAVKRLVQLDAVDQLDALNRAVVDYERRTGTRPESWQALVSAGVLRGVPLDPAGAPYRYDAGRGAVELDARSPLAPLPAEFQR